MIDKTRRQWALTSLLVIAGCAMDTGAVSDDELDDSEIGVSSAALTTQHSNNSPRNGSRYDWDGVTMFVSAINGGHTLTLINNNPARLYVNRSSYIRVACTDGRHEATFQGAFSGTVEPNGGRFERSRTCPSDYPTLTLTTVHTETSFRGG